MSMKSTLDKCHEHLDIMDEISSLLEDESIEFTTNASKKEIIVKEKNKREIKDLVETLPIPKIVLYLLVDVTSAKGRTYIRQKMK